MLGYVVDFLQFFRYITAKWFLRQEVACHRIGSCPTAATDRDILTLATIILIPFKIAELKEKIRFFPDFFERCLFDIAR